jgi:hypothetical protein
VSFIVSCVASRCGSALDASFVRAKPKEGCGYHETALWVTVLLENDLTFHNSDWMMFIIQVF